MKWVRLLFVAVVGLAQTASASLRLPAVVSDHAMLQAEKPIALWGWADPAAQVKVTFLPGDASPSSEFAATADREGKWSGHLPARKSGTAGRLEITSDKSGSKTINDVLVGEVWLGGGQSNMVYHVDGNGGGNFNDPAEAAEIKKNVAVAQEEADAARPPIRYFLVAEGGTDQPRDDVKGQWVIATPKNVLGFSAVAWNFAITLQNTVHVPVGLIVSCVSGTPVQAWMSKETLAATSVGAEVLQHNQQALDGAEKARPKYEADLKAWMEANVTPKLQIQNRGTKPRPLYSAQDGKNPALLYNGMIHGLIPYTLRGVIWFQADGNNPFPSEYSELFQALIKEWRAEWQEALPFYFVEMNNMGNPQQRPVERGPLSLIREQQHGGLLQPGVGMVAAIDVGTTNAHFPNKKPVGERLARLALRDCYGQPGRVDGPIFKGFAIEGDKVRVKFDHAEGLRVRGGGDLKGFAIRGSSGDWVWATGRIDGQDIVLWNNQISAPQAVRYAWAANPITSVENGVGLPLFPFRTDTGSKD